MVMMKSNGYINANKLCADGGKAFNHWLENKHSKKMIKFYQDILNQHFSNDGIPSLENEVNVRVQMIPTL